MTAVEKEGKEAACELINEICDVKVGDVSVAMDQCECLIGAVTVWIYYIFVLFFDF